MERGKLLFAAGTVCFAAGFGTLFAATAPRLSPPTSAADGPVLLSKTGGGNTWENMAELQQAAQAGNPHAQAQLGERLLRGEDVKPDRAAGIGLLEKAARAGEASAAFRLGMLFDDGDGIAQDRARALAYFRAAAAGGATEAFYNVGAAYVSARGVKRDYVEGLAWLMLGTKRGAPKEGEDAVRARLQQVGHPEWITAAEKRMPELERELASRKAVDLLPPPKPF